MTYSSGGMSVLLAPTTCANPPTSTDAVADPASGCNQNQLQNKQKWQVKLCVQAVHRTRHTRWRFNSKADLHAEFGLRFEGHIRGGHRRKPTRYKAATEKGNSGGAKRTVWTETNFVQPQVDLLFNHILNWPHGLFTGRTAARRESLSCAACANGWRRALLQTEQQFKRNETKVNLF